MDQVQEMQNRGDEDLIDEYRAFLQDEVGIFKTGYQGGLPYTY
jgi:hypothetical protein